MEKNHQQKINFPWTIEGWPWAPDFSLDLAHANSSKKQKGTFCQHEAGTFLPQIFRDTSVMLPLLLGAWNWPVLNSKLLTDLSGDCTTPSGWEEAFHQKFFRIPYMDTYILYIYTQLERTRALLDFSTYPGLAMSHCFPSFFSLEHWTSVVFPLFKVSGSWCHPIHRQLSHPSGWSDESFSPLALCESVVPELAILASDFFIENMG